VGSSVEVVVEGEAVDETGKVTGPVVVKAVVSEADCAVVTAGTCVVVPAVDPATSVVIAGSTV